VCGKGKMNIVLDVYALPIQILILMFKTFRTLPVLQDIFRCCRGCNGIGGWAVLSPAQGFISIALLLFIFCFLLITTVILAFFLVNLVL
jgi:hypothetical protein